MKALLRFLPAVAGALLLAGMPCGSCLYAGARGEGRGVADVVAVAADIPDALDIPVVRDAPNVSDTPDEPDEPDARDRERPKSFPEQLNQWLCQSDFFRLKEALWDRTRVHELTHAERLFYGAFCLSAFDDCLRSNQLIEHWLVSAKGYEDSLRVKLLILRGNNQRRSGSYAAAAQTYRQIASYSRSDWPEELDEDDLQNMLALYGALTDVAPPQAVIAPGTAIPCHTDRVGLPRVPVRTPAGAAVDGFVFDTGANLSTVNESHAKRLGMRLIDVSVDVESSTEQVVQTKLGVADSLWVGDLLFRNAVFLVVPDVMMDFPDKHYRIDGIIGLPEIRGMGAVRIGRREIRVLREPVRKGSENLCMDGAYPIVRMLAGEQTLLMMLDTGSAMTELSKDYFAKNRAAVRASATRSVRRRAGAGGYVMTDIFRLPPFEVQLGGRKTTLYGINVLPDVSFVRNKDGKIGQDLLGMFDGAVVDFRSMRFDLVDAEEGKATPAGSGAPEQAGSSPKR